MFKKITPSIIFTCTTLLTFPSHGYCDQTAPTQITPITQNNIDSRLYPILDVTFPPQYTMVTDQWKKTAYDKSDISEANFDRHYLAFQRKYHLITQKQYDTFTHKLHSCQTAKINVNNLHCHSDLMEQDRKLTEHVKPPQNMQQAYEKEYKQINDLENKISNQNTRLTINYMMSYSLKKHTVSLKKAQAIKELEECYAKNCPRCLVQVLIPAGDVFLKAVKKDLKK